MVVKLMLFFLTALCIICIELWFWLGVILSAFYAAFLFLLLKAAFDKMVPAEPKYSVYDRPEGGSTIYMVNGILTPMKPRKLNFLERLEIFLDS